MIENEIYLSNKRKWLIVLLLTMLGSFCLEIFIMLYGTLSKDKTPSVIVPWTFHWIWEIIALICIFYIVKKLKINIEVFLSSLFIGMIISTIVWIFIPDSYKLMKARYYGVESRMTYDTHEEGRYDEQVVYDFPLRPGFLYKANDPEMLVELKEASEDNEYVGTKGFLFWQTGLAYGFIPYGIREFNGADNFLDHVELFFTVGPMVLVDCFITGLYSNFLIFLFAQIIWLFLKKEHIWWYES